MPRTSIQRLPEDDRGFPSAAEDRNRTDQKENDRGFRGCARI